MNIDTLELADNHIQAEGAKYLVEMLRTNFTLQHLVCQSNHWRAQVLFRRLFSFTSVQHIVPSSVLLTGFVQQLSAV